MPILGIMASAMSANLWQPEGAYDSLATITLSTSTASITFTGIPSTYKHLQIRFIANDTVTSRIRLRLNGDTGNNYSTHLLYGDGASALTAAAASANVITAGPALNSGGTSFAAGVVDILDYAITTKYKTVRTLSGVDINGSGEIGLYSGAWLNTVAVTSVTLFWDNSSNIAQNSTFALYGVK